MAEESQGLSQKKISEIIDYARGTCHSTTEIAATFELEEEVVEKLIEDDASIFCCDTCNWWCDFDEDSESNPGNCKECIGED